MINYELNRILTKSLKDKIYEKGIIDIIESYATDKVWVFTFKDGLNRIHMGIIEDTLRQKINKNYNKLNLLTKNIWNHMHFTLYNFLYISDAQKLNDNTKLIYYTEKKLKKIVQNNTITNGLLLLDRRKNPIIRIYHNLYHKQIIWKVKNLS